MKRAMSALLSRPSARSLTLAALTAVANVAALAAAAGGGRIRDLRVVRLLRRLCDQFDWNVLASAPPWVHVQRSVTAPADAAILFAAAALVSVAVLLPVSLLASRAGTRAALAIPLMAALMLAAQWPRNTVVILGAGLLAFAIATRIPERVLRYAGAAALIAIGIAVVASPLAIRGVAVVRNEPAAGAPNIILISIDSLRADHLHSYGYARATSPNLDALASEGTSFETVISPTSWTLPAHMTLLTSLPPEKHGVITNRFRLSSAIPTLPERLQRSGYATAGFVSATYLDGLFGFSRGFDEYDDYTLLRVAGEKSRRAMTAHLVANRAIDWLDARAKQPATAARQPFFLFLHFFDVHYDYNPPPPYSRMFDRAYHGRSTGELDEIRPGAAPRDVDHAVALYDGEIAWVDANIGRILARLRAQGLDRNTIVAVTADHGEEFLDHGQAGHFKTLYDEVVRVPLIVRYPGHVAAGRRVAGQVRLMDVGPTLFSLAGVRLPRPHIETAARSLACFVRPAAAKPVPALPAFGDLQGEIASLRTADAKLIRNLRTHEEEFYDLASDPRERHNVEPASDAGGDPHHDEVAALRAMLEQWRASNRTTEADAATLDEEDKAGLKSLGYMQ
jgi:arylsulfatase A-like enzyme